jgi:hypothetical protein
MKMRRIIAISALSFLTAALVSVGLIYRWRHLGPTVKDFARLPPAIHQYCRDRISRGQPPPPAITVKDLVAGKYISAEDAHAFDGMDLNIYAVVDETEPQAILVRARMPDGTQIVALADGSIQALSKNAPAP